MGGLGMRTGWGEQEGGEGGSVVHATILACWTSGVPSPHPDPSAATQSGLTTLLGPTARGSSAEHPPACMKSGARAMGNKRASVWGGVACSARQRILLPGTSPQTPGSSVTGYTQAYQLGPEKPSVRGVAKDLTEKRAQGGLASTPSEP